MQLSVVLVSTRMTAEVEPLEGLRHKLGNGRAASVNNYQLM